ncbi:MAG TPA: phosphoenolpyruvate--protein phosphotransferase, partial [Alcanivorax sp.]|nr:phosphoenolpyruvate--protein phosphotransferase [Alcanivorax sp.]
KQLGYAQGLTGKVARTRLPVVARVIQDHADYFHVAGSGEERFKSYLGIPLEHDGELHGVLVVQTEQTKTFFHRHIQEVHRAGRDLMASLMVLT